MDYDGQANSYSRYRKAVSLVLDEIQQVCRLSSESKVLEVGSGTGIQLNALVEATNCHGWGIDPSIDMMNQAVPHKKLRFLQGHAEELPFERDFFDLVFSINVAHHLQDTSNYFQEALRVLKPDSMICTATDSEKKIRNRKPLAQYWPETVDVDLKRYPSITVLRQQMVGVGFIDIKAREIQETFVVTDATPYREKVFSCLRLITETEFRTGLRRMEDDLKAGPIEGVTEFVCLWGRRLK